MTESFLKDDGVASNSMPSIVKLYEVVENAKYIVMVMELCDKGNLSEYLSKI